jgi:hypothetical protein
MATTSNAALRKKTPFHVSIFAKQTTRNLGQGSFHPKRYPIKAAKFGQGTRSYIVESFTHHSCERIARPEFYEHAAAAFESGVQAS